MKILLSDKQERRIGILSNEYALIFKAIHNNKSSNTKDKPYCAIELVNKNIIDSQNFIELSNKEIYGFIGLIEVDGLIFIGVITGKSRVASPIPKENVNKIYSVDFFCLNDSTWDFFELDSSGYPILSNVNDSSLSSFDQQYNDNNLTLPKHPCFDLKKLLSNGSFYYSSDFDLTSTLQHRGIGAHSLSSDNYEDEYMWNSFLMQEIITYRDRLDTHAKQILDDEGFLTTVIRGFAETFTSYIRNTKVALTVICKQSWRRAGTRFNARGVDDDSNVANFVETEFIMYSKKICYAFTEIRGSIPVFWEQDTSLLNPKVQITRSIEATQPVFDKHFLKLIKKYGTVHVVNLLSTKSSEIELSQRYKDHITRSKKIHLNENIYYTPFDFHRETSQEGFSAVFRLIPKIMDAILVQGYFAYDVQEKKVLSEQHGIFRTNCLDCLDRTNLVQQVISFAAFKCFLQDFKFIPENAYIDEEDFVNKHNTLWADHGDMISQIYTGTNALKSSFSRKGKMSLAGALSDATKSVSRMYINNFMDKGKQQNIDTLLGRLPHQVPVQLYDPINEYVTSELERMSEKFTSFSVINLFVGTFNVNGNTRKVDLSKWLYPIGEKFKPDIVILGLQEVIELTAGSLLNTDYSKRSFWENMVSECLNQFNDRYILLRVEQVTSMLIVFFVKSDKAKYVKQVEGASKKTGFGGMAGNKGAVAIRFKFAQTSFCFVNMHLAAGVNNIEDRRNDYENIQRGIIFSRSNTISNHDSIFWLGDTNFRLNLPNDDVRRELNNKTQGYLSRLLHYDQLIQEMKGGRIFKGFVEPEIKFRPTYKFDNGTDRYDSSEKARTPSWTDRIVYKGQNIQPLAYSDVPLLISDHKPVFGAYKAKVKHVNETKKMELTQQLFIKYKQMHPDETSTVTSQLLNLGLEDSQESIPSVSTSLSHLSLLDISNDNNDSENSSTGLTLDPLIRTNVITSSTVSSSSASITSSLLQSKKVSSNIITKAGSVATNQSGSTTRLNLRPPPPPLSSINKTESSSAPSSFINNSSTSVTAVNNASSNIATKRPTRPAPPPTSITPTINNNNEAIHDTNKTVTSLPITNKVISKPPGFDGNIILTPKSRSSTPIQIAATISNTNLSLSNEKVGNISSSHNENSVMVNETKHNSANYDSINKGSTQTNTLKDSMHNLSLNSWQPLTPK